MEFKRGDVCFMLENNYRVRQAKVVSQQESLYVIQLIGSCGAMRLPKKRLFATEDDAMASRRSEQTIISPQISVTEIPDVYDGRRTNRSPHTLKIQKKR